jgi:hypothetical protein
MLEFLFETVLVLGAVAVGLFLFACFAVAAIMLMLIVATRGDPKEPAAPVRAPYPTSDVEPARDEELFGRLAREAMAYATRPYVTTIVDANGVFLLLTVSDAFGRLTYAESRRRIGKTLAVVLCRYEGMSHVPSAAAATELPASQVDWNAHHAALRDVAAEGPKLSFIDHRGRRREARIPRIRRHHA